MNHPSFFVAMREVKNKASLATAMALELECRCRVQTLQKHLDQSGPEGVPVFIALAPDARAED